MGGATANCSFPKFPFQTPIGKDVDQEKLLNTSKMNGDDQALSLFRPKQTRKRAILQSSDKGHLENYKQMCWAMTSI